MRSGVDSAAEEPPRSRPPRFEPENILDDQFDKLFRGLGENLLPQRLAHSAALQNQIDLPLENFRSEGPNVSPSLISRHFAGLFLRYVAYGGVAFPCQFAGCLSYQGNVQPGEKSIQQAFARRIGRAGRMFSSLFVWLLCS